MTHSDTTLFDSFRLFSSQVRAAAAAHISQSNTSYLTEMQRRTSRLLSTIIVFLVLLLTVVKRIVLYIYMDHTERERSGIDLLFRKGRPVLLPLTSWLYAKRLGLLLLSIN